MRRASVLLVACGIAPWTLLHGQASQHEPELAALLSRVATAVERYYIRAQRIMCLETVSQQTLRRDLQTDGTPLRRLTYDLRVEWGASSGADRPNATVQRDLIKINNRIPRPKDKPQCLDPTAVSPDTLSMLLASNQGDYLFTSAGSGRVDGRPALMIDYRARTPGPVTIVPHEEGREECWSVDFPGHTRGRIWIDPASGDVLRFDERLARYVEATVRPTKLNPVLRTFVFERVDSSTVYRAVAFSEPEETLMLPRSVESLMLVRNAGVPGLRTTHRFSDYRRFSTDGRLVQDQ